jgi:hypothetical protein
MTRQAWALPRERLPCVISPVHGASLTGPVPVVCDAAPDGDAELDVEPPDAVLELLLELELHPARTPLTARTEASATASRHLR